MPMQTNALSASSAWSTAAAPRPAKADLETDRPLILIVDDDEDVRSALRELLLSVGIDASCFASTRELLHADLEDRPGCLILDVRMPGASGLDLQQHLVVNGNRRPIVFLTGHGDIAMTVQAMKAGAVDFLTKPVETLHRSPCNHVATKSRRVCCHVRTFIDRSLHFGSGRRGRNSAPSRSEHQSDFHHLLQGLAREARSANWLSRRRAAGFERLPGGM